MGEGSRNTSMEDLIKVINQLQDALATTGTSIQIDLPQIAVVGGQSAGKSSVLENIAGRDFLPRGSNIVTRRPLLLQMYHSPHEYAVFLHNQDMQYTDCDQIRNEIEEETSRVAKGRDVSSIPINMRWYSPNVLDLTLIDLPGLTKNPVGDQEPEIVHKIRDMVLEFIRPENTIIVAVSPANQDIANSDAVQIAKLVDPEGNRTIGVLTKLDLMDAGTDAREILENKLLPLKKGYIGVVNRSQMDINENKGIDVALEAEIQFFREHPSYKHMADRMGTKYLQETLNQMLHSHIKEKLPGIRANLQTKRRNLLDQIQFLGGIEENPPSKALVFDQYLENFKDVIQREILGHRLDIESSELSVGVMINQTFYKEVSDYLDAVVRPDGDEILKIMSNLAGVQNVIFPSDQVIKIVVGRLVERYRDPVRQSSVLIAGLLQNLVEKACRQLEYLPYLQERVSMLVNERIQEHLELAKRHVLAHIDAEASFVNTKHPDFKFKTDESIRALQNEEYERVEKEVAEANRPQPKTPPLPTSNVQLRAPSITTLPSSRSASPTNLTRNLYKGILKAIIHHTTGWRKTERREYFFVLTTTGLMWYGNAKEDEIKGAINLNNDIVCIMAPDIKGLVHFSFHRAGGGFLFPPDVASMEVFSLRKEDSEIWAEKFGETMVSLQRNNSITSLGNDDVYVEGREEEDYSLVTRVASEASQGKKADWLTNLRKNQVRVAWKNTVVRIIEDYMAIVDKTIHDLVPKFLANILVERTIDYVARKLRGELLGSTNIEERLNELMTVSDDQEKKKRELCVVLKETENALKIIGEISLSGQQK